MKRIKQRFADQQGGTYLLVCFVILTICMIWSVLMFFLMSVSVANAQRKSAEQILDRYTQNNAIWIYAQIKEEKDTTDQLLTENYLACLVQQQGLEQGKDGIYYARDADGSARYGVENVQLSYIGGKIAKLRLTYTLRVPLQILGKKIWVPVKASAYSRLNAKFSSDG